MRVDCPHCGQPVPLNAPAEGAHCAACSNDFALPTAIFGQILLRFDNHYPSVADPFVQGTDATIEEIRVHAQNHPSPPACEKCGKPLVLTALPGGETTIFRCVACGDPAACFVAPPWLRALVPTATHVIVSDSTAAPPATDSPPAHEARTTGRAVLMPCPGCGASLHLTSETTRTLTCEYCKNDVYLPDDLWRRLHPVRTMASWFVRFEGRSQRELEREASSRREQQERARAEQARREADDRLRVAKAAKETEVARLMTRAKLAVGGAILFVLVIWFSMMAGLSATLSGLGVLAAGGALFAAGVLAKRPPDVHSGKTLPLLFVPLVIVNPLAPPLALLLAINAFRGRHVETTSDGHYLSLGVDRVLGSEGVPFGILLLVAAFLWPALLVTLAVQISS
jgi:hypothetical protein